MHSFRSLSYDRSIASSKASSPLRETKSFLSQFPATSLLPKLIQYLRKQVSVNKIYRYVITTTNNEVLAFDLKSMLIVNLRKF